MQGLKLSFFPNHKKHIFELASVFPSHKKVRDKWNQLVFVPMAVLNRRDLLSGGKAGKREGFNTFNRLPLFHRLQNMKLTINPPQAVLQTMREVFPERVWLVVPPLLL